MNKQIECQAAVTGRFTRFALVAAIVAGLAYILVQPAVAEEAKSIRPQVERKAPTQGDPRIVPPPGAVKPGIQELKPLEEAPKEIPAGPKPVITAEETTHDFGTIWTGPTLTHKFVIKNTGEVPLEIKKVKPSCGCTVAGQYPPKLEPGASGEFPFSIQTNKLRSRFEKSITISSNDPVTPDLRLRLKGEVKNFVDVVPDNANFGRIVGQEEQERILNITNNTDKPLNLTLDVPQDSKFEWTLDPKEPGQKYELRVKAKPPFSAGNLETTAKLKTGTESQPEITVVARGAVPERIDVQPQSITVTPPDPGAVGQAQGLSRVIRFNNYGPNKVKVTEVTADDPEIKVTLNERTLGEAYTVLVQMPNNYQPPASGRTVTIKTDDAEKPVFTIPVLSSQRAQAPERKRPAETMVGKAAPSFSSTTVEGKSLSNTDLKDNVLVMNFFATTCGFCKKQIPRLEPIRQEYAGKPVRIININQTMRGTKATNDEVMAKINEMGFKGEVVNDPDNALGPMFQATSYPTMVVLGKSGNVEAVNVGNIPDLESRLKGQIDALLAGKPVPAPPVEPVAQKDTPKPQLVGTMAPSLSLTTTEGKTVSNEEFTKAPATILNFFAPNCGFCKKQMPRLEEVRKKYADKGVRFINVAQKMRKDYTPDEIQAIVKETGFQGELAIELENKTGPLFQATGFPTMAVVGKSGKVEALNVGNIEDLEKKVSDQLDALIAGKPVPQDAVAQADPAKPATPPTPPKPAAGVGQPAPPIDIKTVDGKPISNAEFAKAPATILNFYANNCGYCKKQIPRLEEMRKKYQEKGVRFVNVAQKMRSDFTQEQLQQTLTELGFQGELAIDMDNKYGQPFGAQGFPSMIVVGKSGKIEAANIGNIADLETRLSAQLDALIEGKPIPASAAAAPAQSQKRPAEELVGKPAPSFDAIDTFEGKKFGSEDFAKNKATVLNFVAGDCGFCKKQVPTVEKIRTEYEAKGVRFVNVVQKMRKDFTPEETKEVFSAAGSKLELAQDKDNKVGQLFKATSFPTMVVVDGKGNISAVHVGAKADLETSLKGNLDTLTGGAPKPATP